MDKPLAARFIEACVALNAPIGKLDTLVTEIVDPAEKAAFIQAVGAVIGDIYEKLMIPILRQYPDLDPDK